MRETEVYLAEGVKVGEVIRRLGVNKITYYRWRQEYGGMKVEQAKKLKDLEKENARLKRLLANAEVDKAIFKEDASGNWQGLRVNASSLNMLASGLASPNAVLVVYGNNTAQRNGASQCALMKTTR